MDQIQSQCSQPVAQLSQCPICSADSDRLFRKQGYWIRTCCSCQHRFAELQPDAQHVATVYDDRYFQGGGAGYPNYLAEAALLRKQGRRYAKLLTRYMQPGRLLDVGTAAGFMLQGFCDYGWEGNGLEPNPKMAEFACRELELNVQTGALEGFYGSAYDLITLIQVVPHFFDLQQAFQVASAHTLPGGFWLIETWNRDSFTARLLGRNWHEYSPPSVLHWFSRAGLQQLAAQHGFEPVAQGRPAQWINAAHAKSRLRYKLSDLPLGRLWRQLLRPIPDSLNLPYPAEDRVWMLFQKRST
jgi:SAM-dependent methyltransferase